MHMLQSLSAMNWVNCILWWVGFEKERVREWEGVRGRIREGVCICVRERERWERVKEWESEWVREKEFEDVLKSMFNSSIFTINGGISSTSITIYQNDLI